MAKLNRYQTTTNVLYSYESFPLSQPHRTYNLRNLRPIEQVKCEPIPGTSRDQA